MPVIVTGLIFSIQLCNFEPSFLAKPAAEWEMDDNFRSFRKLVNGFTPLNDAAERAVKFGSDFEGVITHDRKRRANVLQLVEETHRECPKAT